MPLDAGMLEASLDQLRSDPAMLTVGALIPQFTLVLNAARTLLGVDAVGVMVLDDADRILAAAGTGEHASRLESAQELLGIGPGIDVMRTRAPIAIDDLSEVAEYQPLWDAMQPEPVHAVLSCRDQLER